MGMRVGWEMGWEMGRGECEGVMVDGYGGRFVKDEAGRM